MSNSSVGQVLGASTIGGVALLPYTSNSIIIETLRTVTQVAFALIVISFILTQIIKRIQIKTKIS